MSCVSFLVFVLVLTLSVCASGPSRPTRHLRNPEDHVVFSWAQKQVLVMHDDGTVQLKPSRDHNCHECAVQFKSLCQQHSNVSGCPRRQKRKDNDKLTSTIVMMWFVSAGKYLCMNRNATFYALADPDAEHAEECAFYLVNQLNGRVLIYHFKYPEKKRNCRLSERRKKARNLCVKYYLLKGNDNSLTAVRDKFLKTNRWVYFPLKKP